MNYQIFIILSIFNAFNFARSQYTCLDNPLVGIYNLQNVVLPSPIVMNNQISYCQSLKGSQSCCNSTILNNFGQLIHGWRDQVKGNTNNLNKNLMNSRNQLAQLKQTLNNFVSVLNKVNQSNATVLSTLNQALNLLINNVSAIIANTSQTQQNQALISINKRKCQINVLKLQASLLCAACNPNVQGVANTSNNVNVSLSGQTCQKLSGACYDYITSNFELTTAYKIPKAMSLLTNALNNLTAIANGTISTSNISYFDMEDSENLPIEAPDCANSTSCNFICNNIITNGTINLTMLAIGAPSQGKNGKGRVNSGSNNGVNNGANNRANGGANKQIRLLQSYGFVVNDNDCSNSDVDPGLESFSGKKRIYSGIILVLAGLFIHIFTQLI